MSYYVASTGFVKPSGFYSAQIKDLQGAFCPLTPPKLKGESIMRNRNIQLNIRLTPAEQDKVFYNSRKTNLSVSGYIRMLINGYVPKESPPVEYEQLMKRLTEVYTKLTAGNYTSDAAELRQIILLLQAAITLPEKNV